MKTDTDLKGSVVLVAGGTTPLGEAIVRELILARAKVVVPVAAVADADRLVRIIDCFRLQIVEFDISSPNDVNGKQVLMDDIGGLSAVVDATGGWQDVADGKLDREDEGLVPDSPHYYLASEFFPLLSFNKGAFIQILGTDTPVPRDASSLVRAANAVVTHARELCERPWSVTAHKIRLHSPLLGWDRRREAFHETSEEEVAGLVLKVLLDPHATTHGLIVGVEGRRVYADDDDD